MSQYKTREVEILPEELMTTMTTGGGTTMMTTDDGSTIMMNDTMMTTMMSKKSYRSVGGFESKTNVLGLVVFSCFFGAIIGRMGEQGEPLKIFCNAFMEAIM